MKILHGNLVSLQLSSLAYYMELIQLPFLYHLFSYICCNRHTYLTTDPRVLELISPDCIPFILLHKAGFLKTFITKVIGLVKEGLCISAIERFISSQRRVTEARLSAQLAAFVTLKYSY